MNNAGVFYSKKQPKGQKQRGDTLSTDEIVPMRMQHWTTVGCGCCTDVAKLPSYADDMTTDSNVCLQPANKQSNSFVWKLP